MSRSQPAPAVIRPGDRVRDRLGHWLDVLDGGPIVYRVQALTSVNNGLQPLGKPFYTYRSDLRAEGE